MSKEQNKSGHLIDEATKTPRTQAPIKTYGNYIRSEDAVSIEFAEQLETELAEALETSAIRSRIVNKQTLELAEARAEIERLNKRLGDGLGTIFAMLIAARGVECDIDTLHAEMGKVSKKPSEYIKHVIAERDKLIEQMRVELKGFVDIMRILTRNSDKTSSNEFTNAMLVCIDRNELIIKDALSAAERSE